MRSGHTSHTVPGIHPGKKSRNIDACCRDVSEVGGITQKLFPLRKSRDFHPRKDTTETSVSAITKVLRHRCLVRNSKDDNPSRFTEDSIINQVQREIAEIFGDKMILCRQVVSCDFIQ